MAISTLVIAAVAFGWGMVAQLTVGDDSLPSNYGWIFWAVSLGAIGAAVSVQLSRIAAGPIRRCLVGALLYVLPFSALVAGTFAPYAFRFGARTPEGFAQHTEAEWSQLLLALVLAALIVGSALGCLLGLVSHFMSSGHDAVAS